MSFLKKQTAGSCAVVITLILAVVSIVTYYFNVGSEGYFQNAAVSKTSLFNWLAIVMLIVVFAMAQLKTEGTMGKVVELLSDCLRILVPVVCMAGLMALVSGRVQGFAFIYFSNEEVLQEVQTAANLSSAHGAIANIILLGVTALVGMVAAFFGLRKKEA